MRLTLVLLLLAPTFAWAQEAELAWKFKQGDTFYQLTQLRQDQKITVMGMNVEQKINNDTIWKFTVKKVDSEGNVTIEQVCIDAKMGGAGGLEALGGVSDKMKGTTFEFTIDKYMKLVKFDGYDKFLDKLSEDNPMMKQMMKQMLSDDTFKQSIDQAFGGLPNKTVRVGEGWKTENKMSLGPLGDMKIMTESILKDKNANGIAKIEQTGSLQWTAPKKLDGGSPFAVTKGKVEGKDYKVTINFDTIKGRVLESRLTMSMAGKLTMSVGGMELEMEMDTTQRATNKFSTEKPSLDD